MTLEAVSPIRVGPRSTARHDRWPEDFQRDPRWLLTNRVLAGRHFARSPLLSRFLLHVVAETLAGRQDEITEHQIGVQVFGRPPSYRTVEDNIVRNYARQLRRRLADHFASDSTEQMRIEIPLGGYVPVFTSREAEPAVDENARQPAPVLLEEHPVAASSSVGSKPGASAWSPQRIFISIILLIAYSILLIALTRFAMRRTPASQPAPQPAQILWQTMLNGPRSTYIVPPDAGLNLVEDLSRHPLPLADYIRGGYSQIPLPRFDDHSAQDLRMHEFTDFIDMEIIASLLRQPEFNPQRASLRFPRDLRLDDLKNANALIIGSVCSNPWASLADARANFQIVCSEGMRGSAILNKKPQTGEQPSYVSHWNEPTHVTYALILLVPNLSGNGHLLLLEGLDLAGTQAAAEAVLHSDAIASILQRARRSDGSLGYFEVLLRSTSIESNATDTQIIASRID